MTRKFIFSTIIVLMIIIFPTSLRARQSSHIPIPFIYGKYIWFMGSDLHLTNGSKELKYLENRNLVIPNIKQRQPGWPGTYRDIYFNLDELRRAIAQGLSPSSVQIAIYDPEQYTDHRTPASELADPVNAVKAFAAVAHAHGFVVAYAPSCGLIQSGAMNIWPGRDPTQPAYWKACVENLWSKTAPYVDLIDLQVQGIQNQISKYQSAVVYASRIIKTANPNIKILAQITTQKSSASVAEVYAAAYSVRAVVDGYYLSYRWNDPSEQRLMASFLTKVVDTFDPPH